LLQKAVLAATLIATPVVFAADADPMRDRRNDLGVRLMCMCGCGQLLIKCNHTNCPKSVPMIKELDKHLDAGETDGQILALFVDKYGHAVLSDGGGMKAVPYLVLLGGALVAVMVALKWSRTKTAASPAAEAASGTDGPAPPPGLESDYRRRAEEDLKSLTPED
jgi:cytochrome c-type biogenesis protein CcmH